MLKVELLKSISKFIHPPTPTLAGLPPDTAITNTFRLPNMEDMQLYVVWNSDINDFTESLIFRKIPKGSKQYLCSVRRATHESVTDLVKRTVDVAIQKKDSASFPDVSADRSGNRLKKLFKHFMSSTDNQ